ncbi:MAG TPA: hypothetical protein VJ867_14845, partial [Gemmatimonadaceae bacterium]|nr:hypothetical protein [Gemmatimonadaceae bacterium]
DESRDGIAPFSVPFVMGGDLVKKRKVPQLVLRFEHASSRTQHRREYHAQSSPLYANPKINDRAPPTSPFL